MSLAGATATSCTRCKIINERWRDPKRRHTVTASECVEIADQVADTQSAITWSKRAWAIIKRNHPNGVPPSVRAWAERNLYIMPGRWSR